MQHVFRTENRGRVVKTPVSYSRGPGYKSRTGVRLCWLGFPQSVQANILSNSSFSCHPHSTLHSLSHWKASLNKLQRSNMCFRLKMTAFWALDVSEVRTRVPHHRSHDGGNTQLRNVGLLLRNYAASYPRTLSSYSPPWEPEISRVSGCHTTSSMFLVSRVRRSFS
jgi:hypothetical protein